MNNIRIVGVGLLCLLANFSAQSQMEVTASNVAPFTPVNLIENVFLGSGVEVLDIQFNGNPQSVGFFNNSTNQIGIDRGVVMSTGFVEDNVPNSSFGIENPGNIFASGNNFSVATDPDIELFYQPDSIHNLSKYTITFIPISDTLRFRYVFASEEYPQFACTVFSDIFGFFISGPGINGPFENNGENIALIPSTTLPVTIQNIHPANGVGCPPLNAQYYNDNNFSNTLPVYDGYLDAFTAEAIVVPCDTYTIKLVIADIADQFFDSAVFLEAKSFGVSGLEVETFTTSLDGFITEGCDAASIEFKLPAPTPNDYIIDYTILGNAMNGLDYGPLPANLIIPAGDSVLTFECQCIRRWPY